MIIQGTLPAYNFRANGSTPPPAQGSTPVDGYTPGEQQQERKINTAVVIGAVIKGAAASALIGGGVYLATHSGTYGLIGAAIGGVAGAAMAIHDALNPKK